MSDSLQDQLLALGLAKEKPRKKTRGKKRGASSRGQNHRPRPGGHGARKGKGAANKEANLKDGEISLDAAFRAREREEQQSAARIKAEKRALDLERRRLNTEIEALLKGNALNDREGELKRNFLYKGKIRSVRVNREQLEALNEGRLKLVFLRGDYLLVTPEVAAKVHAVSPEHVPDLGGDDPGEEEHPVPDDLVW